MASRETKLIRASNLLAKYFGLATIEDLAALVALEKVQDPTDADAPRGVNSTRPNAGGRRGGELTDLTDAKKAIIALIIDASEGARTTNSIIRTIRNEILNDTTDNDLLTEIGRLVQIHYGGNDKNFTVSNEETGNAIKHLPQEQAEASIKEIINNIEHPFINSTLGDPTKENPGLSVILSNSTRVSLQQRLVNPVVLFLNTIPNIELQRAVPYVSVEFIIDRPPIGKGGRIQAISLPKFLLGAEKVEPSNTGLYGSVIAKPIKQSTVDNPNELAEKTIAGMELFTSPQTLVSADQNDVPNSIRANPVLDKFRPFMSLNELNISVIPTTGIMSFKTAKLTFVVHDRSRMNEIAEFIRPDFYSRNEISIEYGWSHPDGEKENINNPYGDLLNGLRVREKYMIRNSNFSLDEAGQIVVNLDLAMRGGTDFDTELISSGEDTFGEVIREIRELEETIGELRQRVFPEGVATRQREIRGIQVLNAAQDARNNLTFTSEFRKDLKNFRKSLRNSEGNPDAQALLDAINKLYGGKISFRKDASSGNLRKYQAAQNSEVAKLKRAVKEEVSRKVGKLTDGPDSFLTPLSEEEKKLSINSRERSAPKAGDREQRERLREFKQTQFGVKISNSQPVSLAKLLLHFIGEPLAATKRYDDVQLIFYPFNRFAGAARRLNIGNFVVDLGYFADEFARYRLNHIGRSGNMSLREFTSFLSDTIIDDPAAPSYGLDGLFETVVSEDGTSLSTRSRFEAPEYQTKLESRLKEYGIPGGDFRMPQIDFYIEALPEKVSDEEGVDSENTNDKTILRIHIFDKLATSYESVGSILSATRDTTMTAVGNALGPEDGDAGNSSVIHFQGREYSSALQLAKEQGLIEFIRGDEAVEELGPDVTIRFVGRNKESLKQFLMTTVPYIIYGAGNTAIKAANLASMQDPRLSTVNMLRSFRRREEVRPNGEQPGGLPMKVIPSQLQLQTLGCPIINFGQQFFVDFQTGTTADNIYAVTGLEHRITAGEFSSDLKFVPLDAFGRYESLIGRLSSAEQELKNIQNEADE